MKVEGKRTEMTEKRRKAGGEREMEDDRGETI